LYSPALACLLARDFRRVHLEEEILRSIKKKVKSKESRKRREREDEREKK
jgi:hypothetical protein